MTKVLCAMSLVFALAGCSHSKRESPAVEEKRASGLVEITLEAQQHFGMQVEPVQVHQLDEFLQVPGTVQPIDSRVNTVRPLARGRLHDVLVRVGDRVAKGQPLATYDNMEAGELVAQLAVARMDLERLRGQERNLARQTERSRALADLAARGNSQIVAPKHVTLEMF